MGLITDTQLAYYGTPGNYGNYQFVSLDHIINGFMVAYVGEDKIINKVKRTEVQFHALRGIAEFTYDVFRTYKAQEIEVPNTMQMILPQDYVNYVRITRVGEDGIERPLYPTRDSSNPISIQQDGDGVYQFEGNDLLTEDSTTWPNFRDQESFDASRDDRFEDEDWVDDRGRRYGLDPQRAQSNGSYFIDNDRGLIHFSSVLSGKTVILHYLSDGLGTDAEMMVHKFCEQAMYDWIAYAIVSNKSGLPQYITERYKKQRRASMRNAKIRLSNIKLEEYVRVLKGMGKPIK